MHMKVCPQVMLTTDITLLLHFQETHCIHGAAQCTCFGGRFGASGRGRAQVAPIKLAAMTLQLAAGFA